jgi:hypothetical protein
MTLHPEELLDCARVSTLSTVDREVLDRHVANCPACAIQLRAQGDVCTLPEAWEQQRNQQAIAGVMTRIERTPRCLTMVRLLVPAAVGLLLLGVASAALWPRHKTVSVKAPAAAFEAASTPRSQAPSFAPSSPDPATVVEEPQPGAPVAPRGGAAHEPARSAAELFARGLELRDQGSSNAAIATWRKLQRLYPESRESRLSFALAGSLQLSRGLPREALAMFDRHLQAKGEANEEARAGRAAAFQALNQSTDEQSAWEALLREFPGTVYRKRAEERLRVLAGSPPKPSR